jgi:hypothetical protein
MRNRTGQIATIAGLAGLLIALGAWASQPYLRIEVVGGGPVLVEQPVHVGDQFSFGWEHSLEKIPWDEYYHVDTAGELVLDTIRFPAFGAGIPEAKGAKTWVDQGWIYMGEIAETHREIVWINSLTATKDLALNGQVIARGADLPGGTKLRLTIGPRWR